MAKQLRLIPRADLELHPERDRTEPRLWVRRLVIWSAPGVVLREIQLRPGLNIIWSPDPSDRDAAKKKASGALGHGSGKTLFCRLLRYCLGEDRVADEAQQDRIAIAFKEGLVGAEIAVDGVTWAIVRSIGFGSRSLAVPSGNLDALATNPEAWTGMAPFLEAVEKQVITDATATLVAGDRPLRAWLIALAWLTRDQECRFDDVLDWRSSASESGSPARGLSAPKILNALRALIGALTVDELEIRQEIEHLEQRRSDADKERSHREWETTQARARLLESLELRDHAVPPGVMAAEMLRQAARSRLMRAAGVDPAVDVGDIDGLRAEFEAAAQAESELQIRVAQLDAAIPEIARSVGYIRGERPALSYSKFEAEHPSCPICEVPIDRALAEGCKLSHKLTDVQSIRARIERTESELRAEEQRLNDAKLEREALVPKLASAAEQTCELQNRLQAVVQARDARSDAWSSANQLGRDVRHLETLWSTQERSTAEVARINELLEQKREIAAAQRAAQAAKALRRISQLFSAITSAVISEDASGRVELDGNGLHLVIDLGGERSTAAIESLKVLAFDLATLCMSIEGATHLPAFLVHDSPREADLGLSAYHRLFYFARSLEGHGIAPLFQYIVTTTTQPPEEVRTEPWLRLTLEGTPAEARLLARDL